MEGLCMLCKEPITSPLSIETVEKHVKMWMPSHLQDGFEKISSVLVSHVKDYYKVGDSTLPTEQLVCIHCYVKEVYQWIKRIDTKVGEHFLNVFSLGYKKESFETYELRLAEEWLNEEKTDFGICDECGEYSDKLSHLSGEWVCMECEKYG